MSLTVALSKGKLLAGSESLFRRAGLPFPEDPGRARRGRMQVREIVGRRCRVVVPLVRHVQGDERPPLHDRRAQRVNK